MVSGPSRTWKSAKACQPDRAFSMGVGAASGYLTGRRPAPSFLESRPARIVIVCSIAWGGDPGYIVYVKLASYRSACPATSPVIRGVAMVLEFTSGNSGMLGPLSFCRWLIPAFSDGATFDGGQYCSDPPFITDS